MNRRSLTTTPPGSRYGAACGRSGCLRISSAYMMYRLCSWSDIPVYICSSLHRNIDLCYMSSAQLPVKHQIGHEALILYFVFYYKFCISFSEIKIMFFAKKRRTLISHWVVYFLQSGRILIVLLDNWIMIISVRRYQELCVCPSQKLYEGAPKWYFMTDLYFFISLF